MGVIAHFKSYSGNWSLKKSANTVTGNMRKIAARMVDRRTLLNDNLCPLGRRPPHFCDILIPELS